MPNALRIELLGPLQVRDESGRQVSVGGRQLRVLFCLLALNAGRVVPSGSIAGQIWPDDAPGNPGNALQTLISRLRAELRLAGFASVIESHPAGYRLAVRPDAVDAFAFEAMAARGRRALAAGDAQTAARILRDALVSWRGEALADAAGCDFADVAAARLTELRASAQADRIDPWVRAAQPLMRGTFGSMLGQLDQAESDCRESLAAFRAMNEAWGAAAVLVQLAEFAELRADFPGAIAALDEAAEQAEQLGAWGDLSHVNGKRAAIRLRMGDLAGARADLDRAEAEAAQRGGAASDVLVWLGLVGIELHCREGDMAAARRQGEAVLTWLEDKQSAWWSGLTGLIKVRLALAFLACGDEVRGRRLLSEALNLAAEWVERPVLAAVFDAIAVLVQHPGQPGNLPERLPGPREAAKLAATLLGAAHSVRGCFNEGSLDAPVARDAARTLLGEPAFAAAYARGRELSSDDALALANSAVAAATTAC